MKKIYGLVAIIMTLSIISGCASEQKETSLGLSDSVSATTTDVTTTVATTTQYVPPKLNEDVFPEDTLQILHTDFKPSKELESEILELIDNYGTTCSLYMVNLEDYATFGYNSDTYIPTASTIKCPFAYYCYKEVEKGTHSFDDTLLYRSGYYSNGTGVLKDNGSGTYYTVKDLLYYMIHYSDNVAFLMLQDYFGYEGYNKMMSDYGFKTFLDDSVKWGKLSSHALGYIWTEIYKYKDQSEEGAILYDTLVNAGSNFLIWPFTEAGYDYKIAHKSGWASPGYHDSGIVLSEHPFVIVVMTESEGETRDSSFFYNIVLKLNQLHDEYLEYIGQEPSCTTTVTTEETTTEPTTTTTLETTSTTEPTTTTQSVTTVATTTTVETTQPVVTTQVTTITEPQETVTISVSSTSYYDDNQVTDRYVQYDDDNNYF